MSYLQGGLPNYGALLAIKITMTMNKIKILLL